MANQPKKYKKFVATAATATLVASAIVPVASAATPSFSDIKGNDHEAAIKAVAELGYINGYQDGTFKPGKAVTRGQVALILGKWAQAQGVEVPADYATKAYFNDLPASATDENKQMYALVKAAGIFEGSNGSLNPGQEISRQHMAVVLNGAFKAITGKSLVEQAGDTSNVTVGDINKVAADYRDEVKALKALGITAPANFNPTGKVTRGQFASFLNATIAVQKGENTVGIKSVTALDNSNRYLTITFFQPVSNLDASDITVKATKEGRVHGVKEVKLSANGKVATVELFANDNATSVLKNATEYTVTVDVNGKTYTSKFVREAYLDEDDQTRVISVDSEKRTVTVEYDRNGDGTVGAGEAVTLDVPADSDFNFEEALGQEIRVWYDGADKLVKYEYATAKIVYDAIKVKSTDAEVELIDEKTKFDLASNVKFIVNDGAGAGNGELTKSGLTGAGSVAEIVNNTEYAYAKLIFNDKGDVERVYAYTFPNQAILVEETKDQFILDYDVASVKLKDYVIVKDGKQIKFADIKKDDLVFYNKNVYGDGIAVVYNNTVKGKITAVYQDSFVVDGKNLDYNSAQYIDEKGERSTLNRSGADKLKAGGEVTVYLNFKGEVVVAKGTEGQVQDSFKTGYVTSAILPYVDSKEKGQLELEVATEAGEKLYDFAVKSLDKVVVQTTADEVEFEVGENLPTLTGTGALALQSSFTGLDTEIDEFELKTGSQLVAPGSGATTTTGITTGANDFYIVAYNEAGTPLAAVKKIVKGATASSIDPLVQVATNESGKVTGLKFLATGTSLTKKIDVSKDNFANGSRLLDSTIVIDVDTTGSGYVDADDVTFLTYKDVKAKNTDIDVTGTTVYTNEDGEVTHIIVNNLEAADTTDYSAVISRVDVNKDNEVVGLEAFVNGERKTFTADKLKGSNKIVGGSLSDLFEGRVAILDVNEAGDAVTKITLAENRTLVGTVAANGVNVNKNELTINLPDGTTTTVELERDGSVVKASDARGKDFSVKVLGDIKVGDPVVIGLAAANSKFADVIAIVNTTRANSTDIWAPTSTITNATYSVANDTITLTGTNFTSVGSTTADVKGQLDWTKLAISANDGVNPVTAQTIALADVTSAVITSDTTLTIKLGTTKATALETAFGTLDALDTLTVTAGFTKDAAGKASTTDALTANGLDN
ncbi:S-layer homology domain-containing protein [Ureibacillus composti]